MSKTWLSALAALALTAASVGIYVAREAALGPEAAGERGWKVSVIVDGVLLARDSSISVVRPLDFRRQHISEERMTSGPELREPVKRRRSGQRMHTWRRDVNTGDRGPFHLEYSFLCSLQRPTAGMERATAKADAPPAANVHRQAVPGIESDADPIQRAARENAPDDLTPLEQARALYQFVKELPASEPAESPTALGCLRAGGGDALGKARLLTALCRARHLPTRVLSGVLLSDREIQRSHAWVEAWVDGRWTPMDPTLDHFGPAMPESYLVMRLGDGPLVIARSAQIRPRFLIESLQGISDTDFAPSAARRFWRKISLQSLHVSEQHMAEFLLLLPLGALIVSFARTVIGVMTFGIFAPALIGLAFLDLKALPFGLPIFVLTVLVGWGIRHLLERYHLLQVPRVSAMLTLIVIFLLVMIVTASNLGIMTTRYVSLFPLVILTFLVERFWTIEAEDSTAASFQTLLGTMIVAVAISLMLGHDWVRMWVFRHPETLGVVLAAQFLLGRYTGYRLTELYRFQDLIREQPDAVGRVKSSEPTLGDQPIHEQPRAEGKA